MARKKEEKTERIIEEPKRFQALDNTGQLHEVIAANIREAQDGLSILFAAAGKNFYRDTLPGSFKEVKAT